MNNNFVYNPLENNFFQLKPVKTPVYFSTPYLNKPILLPFADSIDSDGKVVLVSKVEEVKQNPEITNELNPILVEEVNDEVNSNLETLHEAPKYNSQNMSRVNEILQSNEKTASKVVRAAILGNIMTESSFDTTAYNKRENAIGICLWRLDRRTNLKLFARSNMFDIDALVNFMLHEINSNNRYRKTLEKMQTQPLEKAVETFMHGFEGADPKSLHQRISNAKQILKTLN